MDYSSSKCENLEDFAEENIRNGGLENFGEDNIKSGGKAKLQNKPLDLSKIAVVLSLVDGTLENQSNGEGTVSDIDFAQNSEDNSQENQQQIQENLDQGLDVNLEEIFENAPLTPLQLIMMFQCLLLSISLMLSKHF